METIINKNDTSLKDKIDIFNKKFPKITYNYIDMRTSPTHNVYLRIIDIKDKKT